MNNETKIQNQNDKTLSSLKAMARLNSLSTAAYIMYLEYRDKNIGNVYYSRYKESETETYTNQIDNEDTPGFQTVSIMCRDEEAPKYLKAFLFTKNYEEAELLINFRLEKYSKKNNVAFNDIEPAVVLEIMESVKNLFDDARFINFNN